MEVLIDKTLIVVMCILTMFFQKQDEVVVETMLIALIISCFMMLLDSTKVRVTIVVCTCILMCLLPQILFFTPLYLYDIIKYRRKVEGGLLVIISFWLAFQINLNTLILVLLVSLLAAWMELQNEKKIKYFEELIRTRDSSVELTDALRYKNKMLIEKQEYEVYAATLKERNRIAREIHDSVGHVLSRCILQVGALLTVFKEQAVNSGLNSLKESLDIAMNSIRKSVHDLHEASIDLESGINQAIEGMKGYDVRLDYDMGESINNNVRHCILSVVQEAVSNVTRHSNGNKVWINVHEHPAFYQCEIKDNGTKVISKNMPGIGLENIKSRVDSLDGNVLITNENGFRIFVVIPKEASVHRKKR